MATKRSIDTLAADEAVVGVGVDAAATTAAPLEPAPVALADVAPNALLAQPSASASAVQAAVITAADATAAVIAATPMDAGSADADSDAMAMSFKFSRSKRPKKGHIFLTNEQRQAVCIRAATEKTTQSQLCVWAREAFQLAGPLNQSTISRILADKDKYIAIEGNNLNQKRRTHVEHPELESALSHWLLVSSHTTPRIQGDLIKEKGRVFARLLGVENKISFSNGWLTGFKKRHAMLLAATDASGSAPSLSLAAAAAIAAPAMPGTDSAGDVVDATTGVSAVDFGLWTIQQIAQEYHARDIFNVDETGLFYAMTPEKAVRRGPNTSASAKTANGAASKALKEKLTLLLAVNADGSERFDPIFLGRSKALARESPGVAGIATRKEQLQLQLQLQFSKKETDVPFHYCYSARPWLNAVVFQRWLNTLNSHMKIAGRHILLLLDDAPSHVTRGLKLTNVRVVSMPLGLAQPLDLGITLAFKRRYRKRQMVHALDRLEAGDVDIYGVDEAQAMKWVRAAWHDVPKDVVVHSWLQSHVFGDPLVAPPDESVSLPDEGEDAIDLAIKDISYKLPLKRAMALKEILSPPDECDDLHFVAASEADFLAVKDELTAPWASSLSPSSSSNSNGSSNNSASRHGSVSNNGSVVDDSSVGADQRMRTYASAPGLPSGLESAGESSSAPGMTSMLALSRDDSQLPDDELLVYVQKLVPNLERLGCDERTIQALRDVRQTLKQRVAKPKTDAAPVTDMAASMF